MFNKKKTLRQKDQYFALKCILGLIVKAEYGILEEVTYRKLTPL